MRYYKGESVDIYALYDNEHPADWLSMSVSEISEEEALAIVAISSTPEDTFIAQG